MKEIIILVKNFDFLIFKNIERGEKNNENRDELRYTWKKKKKKV